MKTRVPHVWLLCATALCLLPGLPYAQAYPEKSIRFVVPYTPGGVADVAIRIVSKKLADRFGQLVIVDNRGGASQIIGIQIVAKSPPDGYTLLNAPIALASNGGLYAKLPYRQDELKAVILLGVAPVVFVVHPSVPAKSVKEFIAFAAANSGRITYSSAGNGSSNHLAAELFGRLTRTPLTHVPYKGGEPGLIAVVSGEVTMMFSTLATAIAQIKAGKVTALALASAARSQAAPALPTMREAGVDGCEVSAWHGVMVPAGTPDSIVVRLNTEINTILRSADVIERFSAIGLDPAGGTPQEFARFIRAETEKWERVIREAKITLG